MIHPQSSSRQHPRRQPFTLVEMLAVIAIMMILFGIAIAPFDRLMGGGGVDGAARMIGAQLRLARQYALANRKYVAVVMPGQEGGDLQKYSYTGFRSCVVTDAGSSSAQFSEWISDTKWESLPQATAIVQIRKQTSTDGPDLQEPPEDDVGRTVNGVDGEDGVRAIIFAPTGRVLGNTHVLHITEAVVDSSGNLVTPLRNRNNASAIQVDTYTGRTTYIDPIL